MVHEVVDGSRSVEAPAVTGGESDRSWRERWHRYDPVAIAVAVLVLRLGTRAQHPTEWDSAGLVVGAGRFDVVAQRPHAPGYWLFVRLGSFLAWLTPAGTHTGLVLVAAGLSAGASVLAYMVGRWAGGRVGGLSAAALVSTWPIAWFYGSIAASYTADLVISLALVWLALRARRTGRALLVAAALVGLGSGFRPTVLALCGPALLLIAWRSARGARDLAAAVVVLVVSVAAWLVPLALEQPGGLTAWVGATERIWRGVSVLTSTIDGGVDAARNREHALTQTTLFLLPALPLAVLGLLALARGATRRVGRRGRLGRLAGAVAVVGLPMFLVGWLVHYPKAGYLLAYAPLVLVVAAVVPERLAGAWRSAGRVVVVLSVVAQAGLFLGTDALLPQRVIDVLPAAVGSWAADTGNGAPYPYTWGAIRFADREGEAFERLSRQVDPERDVVVFAADNGGYRFRQASVLLPGVPVYFVGGTWQDEPVVLYASREGSMGSEPADAIPIPPGGQAFVVLDLPSGAVPSLAASGAAQRLPLAPAPPALPVVDPAIWAISGLDDALDIWRRGALPR